MEQAVARMGPARGTMPWPRPASAASARVLDIGASADAAVDPLLCAARCEPSHVGRCEARVRSWQHASEAHPCVMERAREGELGAGSGEASQGGP